MDDRDLRTGFYSIRQHRKKILADISQVSAASPALPVCPAGDPFDGFGSQRISIRISSILWRRATAFLAMEPAPQEFLQGPSSPLPQVPRKLELERPPQVEKKSRPGRAVSVRGRDRECPQRVRIRNSLQHRAFAFRVARWPAPSAPRW